MFPYESMWTSFVNSDQITIYYKVLVCTIYVHIINNVYLLCVHSKFKLNGNENMCVTQWIIFSF